MMGVGVLEPLPELPSGRTIHHRTPSPPGFKDGWLGAAFLLHARGLPCKDAPLDRRAWPPRTEGALVDPE